MQLEIKGTQSFAVTPYQERNEAILKASERSKDLVDKERRCLSLSIVQRLENGQINPKSVPIKDLNPVLVPDFVKDDIDLIFQMVGFKAHGSEKTLKALFVKVLLTKFKTFSWQEVLNAFQFAAIGDLDTLKDNNHYQQFSLKYISSVLIAYRRLKMEATNKVLKYLPDPNKKEIPDLKDKFWEQIKTQKAQYLKDGKKPVFISVLRVHEILKEKGFIKNLEFIENDVLRANYEIQKSYLYSELDKRKNSGIMSQNKGKPLFSWELSKELYHGAIRQNKYREILHAFDQNKF